MSQMAKLLRDFLICTGTETILTLKFSVTHFCSLTSHLVGKKSKDAMKKLYYTIMMTQEDER